MLQKITITYEHQQNIFMLQSIIRILVVKMTLNYLLLNHCSKNPGSNNDGERVYN